LKVLDHSAEPLAIVHESIITSGNSLHKPNEQPGTLLNVLPMGRFPFATILNDVTEKLLPASQAEQSRPGPGLLFFCLLIVRKHPWGHRCRVGERRQCSRSGNYRHLGHFFKPSGPSLINSHVHNFCSDRVLPNFMAWWVQ
jgi:hypothetical protein